MSQGNHNNYFDMIMYSAFKTLLMYDDRKSLSYEQLHNYYIYITDMVKIWIKKDDDINRYEEFIIRDKEVKKDFLDNYTNLSSKQERKYLEKFLKNNQLLFFKNENEIYIKHDITRYQLDKIADKNFKTDFVSMVIIGQLNNLEAIKKLGIYKIINYLQELIKSEQMMEILFENYDESVKKLIKNINLLNKQRMSKYFDKKSRDCGALRVIFEKIISFENGSYDFSNNLFSDNLIDNDLFYKNNPSLYEILLDDTDIKLGLWFYSLFSNEKLYLKKIRNQLDDLVLYKQSVEIYNHDEDYKKLFEDNEEDYKKLFEDNEEDLENEFEDDDYEEDYEEDECEQYINYIDEFDDDEDNNNDIFDSNDILDGFMSPIKYEKSIFINTNASLKYIQLINNFENRFGYNEDLTKTKRRILYILNQYGYELYDDGKLPVILENISLEDDDNKQDYKDFYVHARLFLFDILVYNTFDETTLKKILFVSTYYDLTHDKRIVRIIDKYNNTNIGHKVYKAIMNHESNLFVYSNNKQKKI